MLEEHVGARDLLTSSPGARLRRVPSPAPPKGFSAFFAVPVEVSPEPSLSPTRSTPERCSSVFLGVPVRVTIQARATPVTVFWLQRCALKPRRDTLLQAHSVGTQNELHPLLHASSLAAETLPVTRAFCPWEVPSLGTCARRILSGSRELTGWPRGQRESEALLCRTGQPSLRIRGFLALRGKDTGPVKDSDRFGLSHYEATHTQTRTHTGLYAQESCSTSLVTRAV